MVRPRISADVLALRASGDRKGARALKAAIVRDSVLKLPSTVVVKDLTMVFDAPPALVTNREGDVVGVDATVRVFRDGVDLRVDPHRVCINPPLHRPDGTFTDVEWTDPLGRVRTARRANTVEDPVGAYLDWLYDSVTTTPGLRS